MKKRMIICLTTLLSLMGVYADNLSVANVSMPQGTSTICVNLNNTVTDYVAFQMDLTLPDGITLNKAVCSLTDRINDKNQELIIGRQADNVYRLTSASLSLSPIAGTDGALINLSVTASGVNGNTYAQLSNIHFSTINSERVDMDNVSFTMYVQLPAITFADANVKALCVANWDSNGDNELSEAEAMEVTSLGNVFDNNPTITSFNELSYFSNLISINDYAFRNCSQLTSIQFPDKVTRIGSGSFQDCNSLSSVTIPNSVKSVEDLAFARCVSLASITIPNSVTNIGVDAFAGCSGLNTMVVESDNTVYDSRNNCNAIIETTSNTLVAGCKNTIIPTTVFTIGPDAFIDNKNLTYINIPDNVKSIGEMAFAYCTGLSSIVIPQSVNTVGLDVFYRCTNLAYVVMENNTPISWLGFSNLDSATLYVPKGSKTAYSATEYWKDFSSIKEYPDGDVNQDGVVDVVDVVDVARYVIATPSESFDVFLADLNEDKTVNVTDAVVLVNEIAGDTNWSRQQETKKNVDNGQLAFIKSNNQQLSFQLESNVGYTAFQFDLLLPKGIEVMDMQLNNQRKRMHQLLYNKVGEGYYRVVAVSTSNKVFEGLQGELLSITLDGIVTNNIMIDNIHMVTPLAGEVRFNALHLNTMPTGIVSLQTSPMFTIYNLNGQRLSTTQRGLNIINGRKFFVK